MRSAAAPPRSHEVSSRKVARGSGGVENSWMLHSGKTAVQSGLHQGGGVLGSQFQPGSQPERVIVGRFLDELDAQISAIGKAHQQHGFGHPGMLNPYRPARSPARCRNIRSGPAGDGAGENVDVVAERGHDLGLRVGVMESYGAAQHLMGGVDPR
jgi:hypothetical protein